MGMGRFMPYLNRLRFPQQIEKSFWEDTYEKALSLSRAALILGVLLTAAFGVLDYWALPSTYVAAWVIHYLVICPLSLAVLLLSYRPYFKRRMQLALSAVVLVNGAGVNTIIALAQPGDLAYAHYYVGLILIIVASYTFIQLRFWNALSTSIFSVILYEVATVQFQRILDQPMGTVVFITANILAGSAAYLLERYARRNFLQQQALEDARKKSEASLQEEAARALRESETRFRNLIETSINGISIVAADGTFRYVSPSYTQMLGYTPEELIGQPFVPLIHPEDVSRAVSRFSQLIRNPGSVTREEVRLRRKDGTWGFFEGIATRLPNGDLVAYNRDTTERRQIENALRAIVEGTASATSDVFFQSFVQHLAIALGVKHAFIAELNERPITRVHTLAFWSNVQIIPNIEYALPGSPCEQVISKGVCYYPRNVRGLFPADTGLTKLGVESYLGLPLKDADGNVLGHIAVLDDEPMRDDARRETILHIFAARAGAELQRQRADIKLRASVEHFRTLIEISSDAIVIADPNGLLSYLSPATQRTFGYVPAELLYQPFVSFLHPDDVAKAQEMIAQRRGNPNQSVSYELRVRNKDSSWREIEGTGKLLPDGSIVGYNRDITERKRAEAALRESEQSFRTLIELSADGVSMISPDGKFRYASPWYEKTLGYTSSELVGTPFTALFTRTT